MPCRTDPYPNPSEQAAHEAAASCEQRLHLVTRLLCKACHVLDDADKLPKGELREWYAKHLEHDAERIRNGL